jgi:hypothetical protein
MGMRDHVSRIDSVHLIGRDRELASAEELLGIFFFDRLVDAV